MIRIQPSLISVQSKAEGEYLLSQFSDLPQLLQIQKDLWQWPRSRAALMVGSGFSLNATPKPGVTSKFPLWSELTRVMFDELHPFIPEESSAQALTDEFNKSNPLKLASEYEAAFGECKLDKLIRTKVPDSEFVPGPLHRKLLSLPWVDVFTTNYDTLLERTDVGGRVYTPVNASAQLTSAVAPRIIKLHGCFSAATALIITEEHFRTYPKEFAPFVNTVQQSLLENSFVLIGFSGDDPNFLAWTGWIRDHLDDKHPPIYLVGCYGFRPSERLLLHRRGVTPVDLKPVIEGRCAPHEKHYVSIDWFLKCLSEARPPRPEEWPYFY